MADGRRRAQAVPSIHAATAVPPTTNQVGKQATAVPLKLGTRTHTVCDGPNTCTHLFPSVPFSTALHARLFTRAVRFNQRTLGFYLDGFSGNGRIS